jgi:thiamine biosynthesis protein ThiS
MQIKINGENREYDGPPSLGELLRTLGIKPKSVAVERNLRVLAGSEIEAEPVEPGDSFEIIRLVGGG